MVFINLDEAYDKVPKDLIWWVLNKRGVRRGYVEIIKDMYEGAVMSVKTTFGGTSEFLVTLGLHQGSPLSPYPELGQGCDYDDDVCILLFGAPRI